MICTSIYDDVDEHNGKRVSPTHFKHIQLCMRLARMSPLTHKHGCVIVNSKTNEIVGSGYNKKVTNYSTTMHSIHAEVDALRSVNKQVYNKGSYHMYIIRLGSPKGYEIKYSKPCEICTKFIMKKSNRIKKVYYTINQTY
jgi:tRNA(Arg) A34 adenosine deaminase TadA